MDTLEALRRSGLPGCVLAVCLALPACSNTPAGNIPAPVDAGATTDVPSTTDVGPAVDRQSATCVAGRTKACPCADGRTGAQTCGPDGTFGACACFALDAGNAPDVSTAVDAPAADLPPMEDLSPASAPDAAAQTYDYVVNRLILDEGAEPGVTTRAFYGFNLDGRFSPSRTSSQEPADCSHGDYFSAVDPDQNMGTCTVGMAGGGVGCQGGVDNQFPNFAQTIMQFQASLNVQASLNADLSAGRGLMLIRLSGVNGALGPTLNDPAVTVQVYPYVWPAFTDCARVARRDQIYAVDDRSLAVPNDLDSARVRFAGRIVNGRLRVLSAPIAATAPDFVLPLSLQGAALNLSLYQSRFHFTPGETDATAGNLGGYMRQTEFIDALTAHPALSQFRDAAGPLIQGFVDVATGTPTASCVAPQGGIGVGLGFSATRAVILSTTVPSVPVGVCGATAPDAGAARLDGA
ncbi:MAG: hypothetical protein EPO40_03655 [Myxococcaceae bacterium]|nr:MAG: hypothetical protein EPO40_03655 [Myxococcaceae bacterium]